MYIIRALALVIFVQLSAVMLNFPSSLNGFLLKFLSALCDDCEKCSALIFEAVITLVWCHSL